jgi:hypothetical protein
MCDEVRHQWAPILFLASDDSSNSNGIDLADGGITQV